MSKAKKKKSVYEGKRIVKPVSFGETDIDILNYAEDAPNFSIYVKQLIREDMKKIQTNMELGLIQKELKEIKEILRAGKFSSETEKETAVDMEKAKKNLNMLTSKFNLKLK